MIHKTMSRAHAPNNPVFSCACGAVTAFISFPNMFATVHKHKKTWDGVDSALETTETLDQRTLFYPKLCKAKP